jgi:hypothetical protein
MQQKEVIRVGDTIECYKWHKAVVEKIKIISTGKFVEKCKYSGNGYDIMLVLKNNSGSFKMCFKDAPIKIS